MGSQYFEDDFITVIEQVINRKLIDYSVFAAIVKKVVDDAGVIECYCPELQGLNEEDDSENWMVCQPVFNYSFLPAIKDQQVLIFQRESNDWRYFAQDIQKEIVSEHGEKKYIPYGNDDTDTYIIDDDNDDTLTIKKGSTTPEKSLLGETLRDKLKDLISAIRNITVMTSTGPSGTVNDIPANKTALDNIENNIDEILSEKLLNN
jgi:hypothetical protein